jgi:hypothetical protein
MGLQGPAQRLLRGQVVRQVPSRSLCHVPAPPSSRLSCPPLAVEAQEMRKQTPVKRPKEAGEQRPHLACAGCFGKRGSVKRATAASSSISCRLYRPHPQHAPRPDMAASQISARLSSKDAGRRQSQNAPVSASESQT